ncbi:MAG: serine hydroxymethyltransferase, partial [Planctomycetes bacterium]|nr:serine hydroxymethyltransferase [Planctomycetota bacterium]
VMQNKYSEGYPGKRYYGGNEFIDVAENLAIDRSKELFGAEHSNVQPLAGSPANLAAYFALLNIGDKVMALSLAHGGHLTHGSPVNFSGKWYKIIPYEVSKETGMLDYDAIRKQAQREKPDLILCGYTAYPREINFKEFKEIADEVDAYLMADISHIAGLVAGGVHPSPVPYADIVTTTTHKTLRGPRGAIILSKKDYAQNVDKAVFPGLQGGPFDHVIAAKAVCFKEAMQPEFKEYARQIVKNTKELASELLKFGYDLVSGGTDNHLILVDLRNKNITGKEAQEKLNSVGLIVNKNMVPFDTQSPFVTSGIRVGTPGLTTRGMKEGEMRLVAGMMARVIESKEEQVLNKVKKEILELCNQFPIYKELS